MRIFVTGASGHIGSAVVPELIQAGHEVAGLARSDASAAAVTAMGADVRRGDLSDPDGCARPRPAPTRSSTSRSTTPPCSPGTSPARSPPTWPSSGLRRRAGRHGQDLHRHRPDAHRRRAARRGDRRQPPLRRGARDRRVHRTRRAHHPHRDPAGHPQLAGQHGFIPMLINIARNTACPATSTTAPTAGPPPHPGRRPPLPAGAGEGPGRSAAVRRDRRGHRGTRDRRDHRPSPRHPGGQHPGRAGRGPLQGLPVHHDGHHDAQRGHQAAPRLGAGHPGLIADLDARPLLHHGSINCGRETPAEAALAAPSGARDRRRHHSGPQPRDRTQPGRLAGTRRVSGRKRTTKRPQHVGIFLQAPADVAAAGHRPAADPGARASPGAGRRAP